MLSSRQDSALASRPSPDKVLEGKLMTSSHGRRLDPSQLGVIVTCMDRLRFLRRTLPSVLAELPGTYCLVDYGCPERSGAWVESEYARELEKGRILVHRVTHVSVFHKTDALNRGARRAMEAGCRYLCFLDADTAVRAGFWRWLADNWDTSKFLIASPEGARSLFGALVVAAQEFERVGGYDETFRGWGNEDLELRLRLHLLGGLGYDRIPVRFLSGIPHSDALRTRHYPEKDREVSFAASWTYMASKVRSWTGCELDQLRPMIAPLTETPATDIDPTSFGPPSAPRGSRRSWNRRRWGRSTPRPV